MREIHGVMSTSPQDHQSIRQQLLLFDKIYIVGLDRRIARPENFPEYLSSSQAADDLFLLERGVIAPTAIRTNEIGAFVQGTPATLGESLNVIRDPDLDAETKFKFLAVEGKLLFDRMVREIAAANAATTGIETLPLCTNDLPDQLQTQAPSGLKEVAQIVISSMPIPADDVGLADVLDFRAELADKKWNLHRFIQQLASKQQTEAEVRDSIEWALHEYTQAMELHRLKTSNSFVDVFVISPLEVLENIVKFNWSKIAKGALQVRKRKVELLEAEMKAPGRECAYVFDARKRYASSK